MFPNLHPDRSDWRDFYKIGAYACAAVAVFVTFAIAAYFIWPYQAGGASAVEIFELLQQDILGGLMSLDLMMLVIAPINVVAMLAVYAALRPVNEAYALIAFVIGLLGAALVMTTRPLAELVALSNQYAAATSAAEKAQYLTSGETLLLFFEGTAWILQTFFFLVSGLISGVLMLRSEVFSTPTAYTVIFISIIGLGFLLPTIGLLLLFLNTIGSVASNGLMARDFFRFNRQFGE